MNRITFLLIIILSIFNLQVFSQNPVITHMYTADPSARVFNDTLFIYPSHDRDEAKWWDMEDWHVFSTTDLKNYTDHGKAISIKEISWAKKYAWAPDCISKNGKYYFYFPTDQFHIGVAVGNRPCGPFKDVIGKPLISKDTPGVVCNRDFIDPAAFIDDDGTAYLFAGQHTVNAVILNEDMMSYSGKVYKIKGTKDFFEAVWVHKRDDTYYMSYSGEGKILYATSDKPLGPYRYRGVVLDEVNSGTNHHSIVKFKGKWYMFYHNSDLALKNIPESSDDRKYIQWRRSVCVDRLYYNSDGSIKKVIPTKEGVSIK